jgi:hypothetical protein
LIASAPTLIRIIELAVPPAGGFGAGGVKVAVTCAGKPVTLSVTFWLNESMEVTVTIAVLDSVTLIVREFGDTQTPKSGRGAITFRVTMIHFFIGGDDVSVPVMFNA